MEVVLFKTNFHFFYGQKCFKNQQKGRLLPALVILTQSVRDVTQLVVSSNLQSFLKIQFSLECVKIEKQLYSDSLFSLCLASGCFSSLYIKLYEAFFRTLQLLSQTSASKKMITGPQNQGTQKTYMKYTREMRIRLIQLVQKEKMSTAEAGRQVGIKQTSACRIINSYKKHNRIFERKADRFVRQAQIEKNKEQKNSQKDSINSSNLSFEFKYSPKIETVEKNKKSELKLSSSQQTYPLSSPTNCQQKVVLQCPNPLGQGVYNPWAYAPRFQIPILWQFPFLF